MERWERGKIKGSIKKEKDTQRKRNRDKIKKKKGVI